MIFRDSLEVLRLCRPRVKEKSLKEQLCYLYFRITKITLGNRIYSMGSKAVIYGIMLGAGTAEYSAECAGMYHTRHYGGVRGNRTID
jgi:hypothetical protein